MNTNDNLQSTPNPDKLDADKIIIYTKTGCPWCRDALALLKERGLPYKERDGIAQPKYFDEMVKLSGQTKAPTVVFPDGHMLADTDAGAIVAYLEKVKSMR